MGFFFPSWWRTPHQCLRARLGALKTKAADRRQYCASRGSPEWGASLPCSREGLSSATESKDVEPFRASGQLSTGTVLGLNRTARVSWVRNEGGGGRDSQTGLLPFPPSPPTLHPSSPPSLPPGPWQCLLPPCSQTTGSWGAGGTLSTFCIFSETV